MESQQWQYIWDFAVQKGKVGDTLANRGVQGWELVAATEPEIGIYSLFFKKPVED